MDKEEKDNRDCCQGMHHHHGATAGGGAFYGLGFVGALIYYIQHSAVPMDYLISLLKAILWPAFLIHKVFTLLGM